MKDSLLLLSNFIKNPLQVGAVAPSSKFLTREIMRNIDFSNAKNIVELGPGSGTFTKEILKKSTPDARLFCFEINEKFCSHIMQNIKDRRMTLINAGAENITGNLKKINVKKVDCIVSGLPFLNFSAQKKRKILEEVRNSLNDEGKFILFQYTNGLGKLLDSCFDEVSRRFVPLNMPPAFVYVCGK